MKAPDDSADTSTSNSPVVVPLDQLTDTQVFALDPENFSAETIDETVKRLTPILARHRKARDDAAELAALTTKTKKANAAAKKKPAKSFNPTDPMESKL